MLTRTQDTKDVSNGAHKDTRVLELGGDNTGNEETDYLEGSPGALKDNLLSQIAPREASNCIHVEQRCIERGESQAFDNGTREIGKNAIWDCVQDVRELVNQFVTSREA